MLEGLDAFGFVTTNWSGASAFLVLVIGTTLTLLSLELVQAATVCALLELDAERPVHAVKAYANALRRVGPLLAASAVFVLDWIALSATFVLIPVAIWLAIRWCLLAPVATLEEKSPGARAPPQPRPRASALAADGVARRGQRGDLAEPRPLLGALLIFVVDAPLALLNLVAGIVYAAALPFVGLVTAYVYFDARTRVELEPVVDERELPAEIELGRA